MLGQFRDGKRARREGWEVQGWKDRKGGRLASSWMKKIARMKVWVVKKQRARREVWKVHGWKERKGGRLASSGMERQQE